MAHVIYDIETGRIGMLIETSMPETVEANTPEGCAAMAVPSEIADFEGLWVTGGEVQPRPVLPVPDASSAAVGADWTLEGLPAGCAILIDGTAAENLTDGSDTTLVFPVPGVWRVTIKPPFPWLEATCDVEVSGAD